MVIVELPPMTGGVLLSTAPQPALRLETLATIKQSHCGGAMSVACNETPAEFAK
jgi:hypothetical protein